MRLTVITLSHTGISIIQLWYLCRTNKKIPRGPPSPPAPVLHSPTRKVISSGNHGNHDVFLVTVLFYVSNTLYWLPKQSIHTLKYEGFSVCYTLLWNSVENHSGFLSVHNVIPHCVCLMFLPLLYKWGRSVWILMNAPLRKTLMH